MNENVRESFLLTTHLDQALAVHENRWSYHQKIDLLGKMKNYTEARKTAIKAIAYLKREKPDNDGWEYSVREFETN